jgi:hypothetical protein
MQLSGLPPVWAVTEGSTKLVPSRCLQLWEHACQRTMQMAALLLKMRLTRQELCLVIRSLYLIPFALLVPPLLASLRRSPCSPPSDLPTTTESFISRLPPNLRPPTLHSLLDGIIYPVYPINTSTRTSSRSCRRISPLLSSAYRDHIN